MRRSRAQEVRSKSMSQRARYRFTTFSLFQVVSSAMLIGVCGGLLFAGRPPLLPSLLGTGMALPLAAAIWRGRTREPLEAGSGELRGV
jgi:cyanate permease